MNKKELVDAMAAKTDCSGAAADRAENALVEIISDTLKKRGLADVARLWNVRSTRPFCTYRAKSQDR
jgi:hypothetical protein